jgi:tetratricopeptide (TPR) repeat protein
MRNPLLLYVLLCAVLLTSCQPSPTPAGPTPKVSATAGSPPSPVSPAAIEAPGFLPIAREEAPLSLTTDDGTGLKLVSVRAQAVLEGPLAFTQLHLVFENPEDRVLEGRFEITMPDRAAISRFAMKIDDRWQEAEVVERQAAQQAYEDFLHRRQDPALLEKEAGNEFRARIFPIPAKGRKDILISYSQELESSSTPYVLPLAGLPKMDDLLIEIRSGGKALPAVAEKNFQPTGDYGVPQDGGPNVGLVGGDVMLARVRPAVTSLASRPEDLLVLFDTSASRGLGFNDQVELLADLLKELPSVKKVTVAAFDQGVEVVYQGDPAKFSGEPLRKRKALGATDLQAALVWAAAQKGHTRLLLVTDGIATAGQEKLAEALQSSALQRLDVLLVGGIRNKDHMDVLVTDTLAQAGAVLDSGLAPRELAGKLGLSVTSGVDVAVEGAKWVWPTTLDSVQPGDERLVYAQMAKPTTSARIALGGGKPIEVALQPVEVKPLLSRQAMVAQIARLESLRAEAKEGKDKVNLAKEIVELSIANRVLSDLTAMLVLETEFDYQRFAIDRKALVDILEVTDKGLVLSQRNDFVFAKVDKPKPIARGGAADDGVVRESRQIQRDGMGSSAAPSSAGGEGDYVHEVESSHYLVAQNRTADRFDNSRGFDLEGAAVGEAEEGPAYNGVQGLIERSPDAGAEFSQYREAPQEGSMGATSAPRRSAERRRASPSTSRPEAKAAPLDGQMAEIDALLKGKRVEDALEKAWAWQQAEPGNVLALLAVGDCLEAKGDKVTAARVYGSIIDLFPSRADLRRFAGSRLQGLGKDGLPLAVDTFGKAVEQRPDHVSSHRFLALALARQGNYDQAFDALEKGLGRDYPDGRFAGGKRVLGEDLGLIGAAWAAKEPAQKKSIQGRLGKLNLTLPDQPSLRFILTWETDANDVDFHIRDAKGGHAYYQDPKLSSGGQLFADVTTGYGPECFAIDGRPSAYPYSLQIHYYSRGPMGYGMGQLEVLQHDGKGGLAFDERPYVAMTDGAYVDLGVVEAPLKL